PAHFKLDQNYPNPFNPTTTITYRVDHTGQVSLKVFNVIGREMATLVDGTQAAGQHEVKFDATNFPSGVYFYRLQAGGQTETRGMELLK
ncbi:MAG: T9SS type A sorting domain-containing protein, partial [bacterium]